MAEVREEDPRTGHWAEDQLVALERMIAHVSVWEHKDPTFDAAVERLGKSNPELREQYRERKNFRECWTRAMVDKNLQYKPEPRSHTTRRTNIEAILRLRHWDRKDRAPEQVAKFVAEVVLLWERTFPDE